MEQLCGMFGGYEIVLIVLVVLIIFGGKKIPELARGLGKGVKEFKDATEDVDFKEGLKDIASEVSDLKDSVDKVNPKKAFDDIKKPFKAPKKK
jgi:sec-independent protein translocase protein TatA